MNELLIASLIFTIIGFGLVKASDYKTGEARKRLRRNAVDAATLATVFCITGLIWTIGDLIHG